MCRKLFDQTSYQPANNHNALDVRHPGAVNPSPLFADRRFIQGKALRPNIAFLVVCCSSGSTYFLQDIRYRVASTLYGIGLPYSSKVSYVNAMKNIARARGKTLSLTHDNKITILYEKWVKRYKESRHWYQLRKLQLASLPNIRFDKEPRKRYIKPTASQ